MKNFVLVGLRNAILGAALAVAAVGTPASAEPGDTMWVTDVWIERGEEVWVWKEMVQGSDNRWYETGNWAYYGDGTPPVLPMLGRE